MMKITIDGRELKTIIEKAVCNMNKKAALPILRKVVLIDNGDILQAYTTDLETYLQINTSHYNSGKPGSIGIDEEDLKVLLKMNNEVTITELETSILVQNGKKSISLQKYDISEFPNIPEAEYTEVLNFKEWELQEIISNLVTFTSDNESNKIMQTIHFNVDNSRIESLDGYRIGMRIIEEEEKIKNSGEILIHNMIASDMRKIFNKKSNEFVTISESEKYVKLSGKDFTYIQRRLEGEYFKVSQILANDYDFSFKADTKKMLEHMKYYTDNVIGKADKTPVVFKIADRITTYGENARFQVSDELEIKEHSGKELVIAFNPYFIVDALKFADSEDVCVTGTNPKAPVVIKADKYSFLVLPVNINDMADRMEAYLSKTEVA